MGGRRVTRSLRFTAALVLLLGVAGCAAVPENGGKADGNGTSSLATLAAEDQRVINALGRIAARDADTDGQAEHVECWAPSQHPVSGDPAAESAFRVLCRVHFVEQGTRRYRDMICIGNAEQEPVSEYCYQWAYYADAPKFEDQPAYPSDLD